ncbi:hypothetical protein [Sulfurospirillum oryzae]|uniref:hypothetical protein n=1 Tax=Sulfurospirillum oryzae TaxID=2976535 RepID=UPI0021E85D9F|nr:hypothetical protein [Sulfurospirillum oryzae]
MHQPSMPLHVEKHLLSLFHCGCYINTQEIIRMGSSLGIELPFKKRAFLMQTLLLHVKETEQEQAFLALICDLLKNKAQTLQESIAHYPKTALLLQPWLMKIEKTTYLLKREFTLHVKDENA